MILTAGGAVSVMPKVLGLSEFAVSEEAGVLCFRAGIIKDELVGLFRVVDVIKMTCIAYINTVKENLIPWYKKKTSTIRRSTIFIRDDAPSSSAKVTMEYLTKI